MTSLFHHHHQKAFPAWWVGGRERGLVSITNATPPAITNATPQKLLMEPSCFNCLVNKITFFTERLLIMMMMITLVVYYGTTWAVSKQVGCS